MNFFLDENFPKSAATLLLEQGHDVTDIRGTPHEGANDATIFELAQGHEAVFLNTDRDFFHTVPHLYATHYGVVVIALRQPNRMLILKRLDWFLKNVNHERVANHVFQLRDDNWRVRPPDTGGGETR